MKFVDYKGNEFSVHQSSDVTFLGERKVERGFFRWIILALIFFPLVLLFFVSGTKVEEVKVNGKYYLLYPNECRKMMFCLQQNN